MDEYSWASAVGRIRILEKRFLSRAELLQLAATVGLESTLAGCEIHLRSLYSQDARAESTTRFFRDLVAEYDMIAAMSPEPRLSRLTEVRHDFHNLKVIAKPELGWRLGGSFFSDRQLRSGSTEANASGRLAVNRGGGCPKTTNSWR